MPSALSHVLCSFLCHGLKQLDNAIPWFSSCFWGGRWLGFCSLCVYGFHQILNIWVFISPNGFSVLPCLPVPNDTYIYLFTGRCCPAPCRSVFSLSRSPSVFHLNSFISVFLSSLILPSALQPAVIPIQGVFVFPAQTS